MRLRYDRRSYLKNRITKPKARHDRRSYLAFSYPHPSPLKSGLFPYTKQKRRKK